jgi:hypothetical protein
MISPDLLNMNQDVVLIYTRRRNLLANGYLHLVILGINV